MKKMLQKITVIAFLSILICSKAQNFQLDSNYNARLQGTVQKSIQLSNGKTLVCGYLGNNFNSGFNNIVLLNANGSVDSSFQCVISNGHTIYFAKALKNGKIMIGGDFTSINSISKRTAAILNTDGSLDQSFSLDLNLFGGARCYSMEYAMDGQYYLTGNISINSINSTNKYEFNTLVKVDSFGKLDTNFKTPYKVLSTQNSKIKKVKNNKYYLVGSFAHHDNGDYRGIVRLNSDGSLDTSFKIRNFANLNGAAFDLVELADKSVIVGGQFSLGNLNSIAKFNESGHLDSTFIYSLGVEKRYTGAYYQYCSYSYSCGSFLRPRTCYSSYICGTTYYDYWGQGVVYTLSLLPNGNLFIGGDFGRYNGNLVNNGVIVRTNGSIDNSMNIGFGNVVSTSEALNNNEILVGGLFNSSINSVSLGNFVMLKKFVKECGTHLPLAMEVGVHSSSYSTTSNDGYRHFCSNSDKLLLSLKIDTSGALINDNSVTLKIDSNFAQYYAAGIGFVSNPQGFAMWNRSWDVNPIIQPNSPVKVKYYFNQSMLDSLNKVLNDNQQDIIHHADSLYFFKVTNQNKGAHPILDSLKLDDIVLIKNENKVALNSWKRGFENNHNYAEFEVSSFSGGGGGGSPSGLSPLPIEFINFEAIRISQTVKLKWVTSLEIEPIHYIVQKSNDGINWNNVTKIEFDKNQKQYIYFDNILLNGTNFYRILAASNSNQIIYSEIKSIKNFTDSENLFEIFPNPVQNEIFINSQNKIELIEIMNFQGQVLEIHHNKNEIKVNNLNSGLYYIRIIDIEQNIKIQVFVKE